MANVTARLLDPMNSFSSMEPDLSVSIAANTFSWYVVHSSLETMPSLFVSIMCIMAIVRNPLAYPPVAKELMSSADARGE